MKTVFAKVYFKFLGLAMSFMIGVLVLGAFAGEIKSPPTVDKFISSMVSAFLLMGLFTSVVYCIKGIRSRFRKFKTTHGPQKIGNLSLALFYVTLIPYCLLWMVAECVWIYNFGYTKDPILWSIMVIVLSGAATVSLFEPRPEENLPARKGSPVLMWASIIVTIAIFAYFILPFLVNQGRRNWHIVTEPNAFAKPVSARNPTPNPVGEQTFKIGSAFAAHVPFPQVPASQFVDLENHIHQKIVPMTGARQVSFTIECNAASNNALRLWVGHDQDGNGELEPHEVFLYFGWDAGDWVFESVDQDRLKFPSKSEDIRKRLELNLMINAGGECVSAELHENGEPLADVLALQKVLPLQPDAWNLVRIIRNGATPPEESTSMQVLSR